VSTPIAWNPACRLHYAGAGHPERPQRFEAILEALRHPELKPHIAWIEAKPADRAAIERVHPPEYVDLLEALAARGGGALDGDTFLGPRSLESVLASAGVAISAVEQGINPDTTYYVSAPFVYKTHPAGSCDDGTWWCVHTYANDYYGWSSIRSATLRSDNSVYAQLTLDVTPERVADVARRMGVRSPLDVNGAYVPSIGLGSIAVSPLDLTTAYSTLANGGVHADPMAIRKVILANGRDDTDAGWGKPKRHRAISEGVAAIVTRILEENVQSGTGIRAAMGRPAAGKTGTNENHEDAWFAGFTPELATTVWVGYTRGEIPMLNVHGIAVAGGTFPAEIWRLFMEPALDNTDPEQFPEPSSWPTWKPFTRGKYALAYDPSATPSTTTTSTTTETTPAKPPPSDSGPRSRCSHNC